MRTLLRGRRRLMTCPRCPRRTSREFEEEDIDKWADEFGRWWFRSEVYLGGGFCTTPLVARSGGTSPGGAGELLWSFCSSFYNDRCRGGFSVEHKSLFMRQSTVALGRISCFSCTRSSHLEAWCTVSSWLRVWQLHVLCLGVA